ncbi:COG2931 [Vibrio sp. B1REV9]|nr:COG2931 [Vibrio sp. B1REV9]
MFAFNTVPSGQLSEDLVLVEVSNSNGVAVYEAIIDGTTTPVFRITLDASDDSYQFDLLAPLDHATADGENELVINLPIQATDFDGDVSNVQTLPITVVDDVPTIGGVTPSSELTVDEDDLPKGSDEASPQDTLIGGTLDITEGADQVVSIQLNNLESPVKGLTSGGDAIALILTSSSGGVNVYQGVAGTPQQVVFELTFDARDNSYQFDLKEPLDHPDGDTENQITLELPVTATDKDGDESPEYSLAIKVVDDIPVVTSIDTLEVNEDDLSQGSDPSKEPRVDSGQFDITSADGIDSFELDLTPGKIPTLTSGGDEVSITLDTSASSVTSLVYIGETAGGETIFTLTLHQDGRYDFELSGPLDHAVGSDEILLNLPIIITDGDKDAITATLPVKIADDKPALDGLIDGSVTKIDEDDIQTIGSEGSSQLNSVKGNFNAIDGSDGIVEYQVTDLDSPVKDLTSGGQDLVLVEVSNSNGVSVYEARIDGTTMPVFRITLDASDDSYQFDLLAPLDHAIADGENELVINLPIQATDFDGDVSNVQTLPITVVDDLPALVKVDDSSTTIIDEDDLKVGSDTTGPRFISGSFDVIDGADQITHYQVADLDAAVSGLQSNKQDIELKEVSSNGGVTIYEAVIVGTSTQVFTLTLDANNDTYRFDLIRPVDHASGGEQNRLTIDIPISATDYDGDTTTSVDLPITIVDDVPEIKSADTLFLDEDDLPNGSEVLKDSLEATGNFDTEQGADTVASYQLTLSSQPMPGITSEGQSVTLVQTDVTNNNYTYQGKTPDGKAVFTVLLNSDGSYKFTLNGAIDHGTQGEDELTVNLPVFATDVDGDVSTITLPVVITDDVPTIHNHAINVVEGKGSSTIQLFLDPTDNDLDYGADGAEITSFTAEPSDVYFVVNGVNVAEVELNGSDKVVSVHKTLDGVDTEIGRLTVNTDGSVRFRANDDLDHSEADPINFTLKVTATDGDQDTSSSDVDISITDRDGKIQTANVLTFEDRGRDGVIAGIDAANPEDNLSTLDVRPANVNLVVDLNDVDRNETLGDITILKANTHNGTFYYRDGDGKFVELVPTNNKIVLDASNVDQTVNGELVTLNNLFFIPDRHFSTDEDGFSPRIQVEILNNGTVDHVIGGRLNIQVDSIADIATWKTTSTFDYVVDEDDQNVSLSIEAETQDTSDPETIVYELVFTGGESNASLVYSDGTPLQQENGKYFVDANRIGDVEVDPIDNFSGSITLNITAITTERENALSGKQTARSETQEIVIDVQPVADEGAFSVNRINIFEDNARTQNTIDPVSDHDPLLLNEVINMKPSSDVDGSETLFVRISNFSDDGVTLVWLDTANPSQINTVTDSSGNVLYYEIPESHLADVEVLPPLHSNEDFTFDVEGIIKDNATLSSGPDQDVLSLGTKTVNVAVKGVADIPDIILIDQNNDWQIFSDATGAGIETTIPENGAATLSFSVVSGEFKDAPLDGSESLTVILSNIPNGVNVVDADGDSVDLTFVGYDSKGEPIYEANITGRNFNSGIQIIPTESSTENIHITGTLIVTENDGHTRIVDREIRIKVEPVIDAQDNYVVTSEGNEDTRINIDWEPSATQSPDADEFYAALTISGFPPGSTVYVDGSAQLLTGNSLTLTPLPNESEQDFSARVTQTGYIQVQLEENSSTDFDLLTQVTVKEVDAEYVDAVNPGEGIVSSVINGTVKVQVNPVVENENLSGDVSTQTRLLVEEADGTVTNVIRSTDLGNIDFTINTPDGGQTGANIIKYQEFDLSSKEVVTQLVVQFNNVDPDILDQLIIIGASNEGNGRWTITDENNFTILAPAGLDLTPDVDTDDTGYSQIGLTIYAQVNDLGEDAVEKDATQRRETEITLEFPTKIEPKDSVAAEIKIDPDVQIDGHEDNTISFGSQLASKASTFNSDGVEDVLTVVIKPSDAGLPPGLTISGANVDFVDGVYVFQAKIDASGNITGLDGLTLKVAQDWAGDFELPVLFVTTDTLSGDENLSLESIPVQILPVADVPDSSPDQPLDKNVTPNVTLDIKGTLGLDSDKQPVNDLNNDVPTDDGVGYEDGLIQLDLNVDFADVRNSSGAGRETLTSIKLTLADTALGEFVHPDGTTIGTSIEFTAAEIAAGALDNVLFKPKENYPVGGGQNTVTINVEGEITDTAVINQTTLAPGVDNKDVRTFTDDVTFEITPVVDSITISGADITKPIVVTGDEDSLISLVESGKGVTISLNDNDGSEEFVSLKLTDIPPDFIVQSNSSDYTVKNNGGGEWSIQLKDPSQTSIDLSAIEIQPPKNFSGEAKIGITVFTQEELLKAPTMHTSDLTIVVNPIGDIVDVNPDTQVSGNEGDNIDININGVVVDNRESIGDGADYQENEPETLRIEVSNVPDGAGLSLTDGTAFVDQGNGIFVLEIAAQDIDKVVFNSGDRNDNSWSGNLEFKVHTIDTGLDGSQSVGPEQQFTVNVDVAAVNDRPEFTDVIDIKTKEDESIVLNNFKIADVDAELDDPTAEYTIDVSVTHGILNVDATILSTFGLTVQGNGTDSVQLEGTLTNLNDAIANGVIEFKPEANFFGDVPVDISVDDQGNKGLVITGVDDTLNTNNGRFIVEVTSENDAPETTPVTLPSIEEDRGVLEISQSDLLKNATDVESDNLVVSDVKLADPTIGSLDFNSATGLWEFTPAENYFGPVELTYVITDDGETDGSSDPKNVSGSASFVVEATNDAPEISANSVTDVIDESDGQKVTGISVSDVDFSGTQANDSMTVSLSVSDGDIRVEIPTGIGVTVGPGVPGQVILMGTPDAINSVLNATDSAQGLFIDAGDVGSDSITLSVRAEDNGVYYENASGTKLEAAQDFVINVTPVADAPTLMIDPKFNFIRQITASQTASNQGLAIVGIMAALTDSSEVLSLELTGVPDGATVTSSEPTSNISFDGTKWIVPADEIDSLRIEGADVGTHDITLTAVSTESNGDEAESTPLNISLEVTLDGDNIDQSSESEDSYLLGDDSGISLLGGAGDDVIIGGDGDDILIGGLGSDILTGGDGNDTFKWTQDSVDSGAVDTITDFTVNEDTVDLRDVISELNNTDIQMEDLLDHIHADYDSSTQAVSLNITTDANVQQTIVIEHLGDSLDFSGMSSSDIVESLLNNNVINNG